MINFKLLLIINVICLNNLILAQELVGEIPYEFNVESGDSVFNIPISTGKGVNKLELRNLALQYKSSLSSSDGLLGLGWNLGGLSSIERCFKDYAHDGRFDKIRYNYEDRFCLDKQRLVLVNGSYGYEYSEYRTEMANNDRIVAYGQQGLGPKYFKVYSSDNRILTYGFENSVESSSQTNVLTWYLTKIEDYLGNTIKYCYFEEDNHFYISNITFANKIVQFDYEFRQNVKKKFYDYTKIYDLKRRLVSISVYAIQSPNSLPSTYRKRSYLIEYANYNPMYPFSNLIKRIRLCVQKVEPRRNNASSYKCLKPIAFNYNRETNKEILYLFGKLQKYGPLQYKEIIQSLEARGDVYMKNYYLNELSPRSKFCESNSCEIKQMLDMNGDGRADFLAFDSNGVYVTLNAFIEKFGERTLWTYEFTNRSNKMWSPQSHRILADLNGDRLPDLIGLADDGVHVALNCKGERFEKAQKWFEKQDYNDLTLTDVNNDGLLDLLILKMDGIFVLYNDKGVSFKTPQLITSSLRASLNPLSRTLDFSFYTVNLNADGLVDFLTISSTNKSFYFISGVEQSELKISNRLMGSNIDQSSRRFVDINNDDLPDLIAFSADQILVGIGQLYENKFELVQVNSFKFMNTTGKYSYFVDMNNDGFLDAVVFDCAGVYVLFGNGQGGFEKTPKLWTKTITTCDTELNPKNPRTIIDVDGNGSLDLVAFQDDSALIYFSFGDNQMIMNEFKDSLGNNVKINYGWHADVTNSRIEKETTEFVSEDSDFSIYGVNKRVVKSVDRYAANLINTKVNKRTAYYDYGIYKCSKLSGNSECKYSWIEVREEDLGDYVKRSEFYGQSPLLGRVKSEKTLLNGMVIENQTNLYEVTLNNSLDNQKITRIVLKESNKDVFNEKNGAYLYSITTKNTYDKFGQLIETLTQTTDKKQAYREVKKSFELYNNLNNWFLGQILSSTESYSNKTQTETFKVVQQEFDQQTRLLVQKTQLPNDRTLGMTTTFKYDLFGNLIDETQTPLNKNFRQRSKTYLYDMVGLNLLKSTNEMGFSQMFEYDLNDNQIAKTNENSLRVEFDYDELNREVFRKESNGKIEITTYTWDKTMSPISVYRVTTQNGGRNSTIVGNLAYEARLYDSRNRLVRKIVPNVDGVEIFQDILYNNTDQMAQTTSKYRADFKQTPSSVYFEYDELGRLSARYEPSSINASVVIKQFSSCVAFNCKYWNQTTYNGFSKFSSVHDGLRTVESDENHVRIVQKNIFDQIEAVNDSNNAPLTYEYDFSDNLISVRDEMGGRTAFKYDLNKNIVESFENNFGKTVYEYNAFNELISVTDALNRKTVYERDQLGRIVRETSAEREIVNTYDHSEHGIGKLSQTQITYLLDSNAAGVKSYSTEYFYDEHSRERSKRSVLCDRNNSCQVYMSHTAYHASSDLIKKQTYPNDFNVFYCYDSYNYLKAVSITHETCESFVWQAVSYDEAGSIIKERLGNGLVQTYEYDLYSYILKSIQTVREKDLVSLRQLEYTFDLKKNMKSKRVFGLSQSLLTQEAYAYDQMDRIVSSESFHFDANNLLVEQEFHKYAYDSIGNIRSDNDYVYTYDELNNKPQQAIKIGNEAIEYDLMGNVVKTKHYEIKWNALNKADWIRTNESWSRFAYDSSKQKIFSLKSKPNRDYVESCFYFDNVYEMSITSNKTLQEVLHKYSIRINGLSIALHVKKERRSLLRSNENHYESFTLFMHNDLTDSVDTVTDSQGQVLYRFSFKSYGNRQTIYQNSNFTSFGSLFNYGFTGHEYLLNDDSRLIYMNGRLFDSVYMRFLSSDPYVVDYYKSLSLNRYVYCLNNPFKFKDPSGHIYYYVMYQLNRAAFFVMGEAAIATTATMGDAFIDNLYRKAGIDPNGLGAKLLKNTVLGGAIGLVTGGIPGLVSGAIVGLGTTTIEYAIEKGMNPNPNIIDKKYASEIVVNGAVNKGNKLPFLNGLGMVTIQSAAQKLIEPYSQNLVNSNFDSNTKQVNNANYKVTVGPIYSEDGKREYNAITNQIFSSTNSLGFLYLNKPSVFNYNTNYNGISSISNINNNYNFNNMFNYNSFINYNRYDFSNYGIGINQFSCYKIDNSFIYNYNFISSPRGKTF